MIMINGGFFAYVRCFFQYEMLSRAMRRELLLTAAALTTTWRLQGRYHAPQNHSRRLECVVQIPDKDRYWVVAAEKRRNATLTSALYSLLAMVMLIY